MTSTNEGSRLTVKIPKEILPGDLFAFYLSTDAYLYMCLSTCHKRMSTDMKCLCLHWDGMSVLDMNFLTPERLYVISNDNP